MVKRNACYFGFVFILLLMLVGCGQAADQQSPGGKQQILIAGSSALQPWISQAATTFEKQHQQILAKVRGGGSNIQSTVQIQVQGGGNIAGLQVITQHKEDIGMTDVYADPVAYSNNNLTDQTVIIIPFVLIVNPNVIGVQSLTSAQIADIFSTHAITNWNEVGGPNLPIVPFSEDSGSPGAKGNPSVLQTALLHGKPDQGTPVAESSPNAMLDTVAHTPGAIGYLPMPLVNSSVQTLSIDGTPATATNIQANSYRFWSYGHLYTLNGSDSNISNFLDYLITPDAQHLAQNMGYIPLSNMKNMT